MNSEDGAGDIIELTDLYELLEKDAKLLVEDFNEGVGMWKLTSTLLFYFAIVGVGTLYNTLFPQVLIGNWRLLALTAELGLIVAGLVGWTYTRRKYGLLRKKYGDLFKAAVKLK